MQFIDFLLECNRIIFEKFTFLGNVNLVTLYKNKESKLCNGYNAYFYTIGRHRVLIKKTSGNYSIEFIQPSKHKKDILIKISKTEKDVYTEDIYLNIDGIETPFTFYKKSLSNNLELITKYSHDISKWLKITKVKEDNELYYIIYGFLIPKIKHTNPRNIKSYFDTQDYSYYNIKDLEQKVNKYFIRKISEDKWGIFNKDNVLLIEILGDIII